MRGAVKKKYILILLTFIPFGVNMYMSAYCAGNNSAQNNITSAHSIVQTYKVT